MLMLTGQYEMWDGEAEFVIQGEERIVEATAFCVDRFGEIPNDRWMMTTPSQYYSRNSVASALFVIYDETAAFEFRMRWS